MIDLALTLSLLNSYIGRSAPRSFLTKGSAWAPGTRRNFISSMPSCRFSRSASIIALARLRTLVSSSFLLAAAFLSALAMSSEACVGVFRDLVAFCENLLSRYGHQAEGIRTMTRPVMLWPKANAAFVVFLLVIPTECIQSRLRCFFVEPDGWEISAARFDACLCSALALIWDDSDAVASSLDG